MVFHHSNSVPSWDRELRVLLLEDMQSERKCVILVKLQGWRNGLRQSSVWWGTWHRSSCNSTWHYQESQNPTLYELDILRVFFFFFFWFDKESFMLSLCIQFTLSLGCDIRPSSPWTGSVLSQKPQLFQTTFACWPKEFIPWVYISLPTFSSIQID